MTEKEKLTARESFNRLLGLSSYAGEVIVLGLMAFSLYDSGGFDGDYESYGIGLAAALVLFAVGYTTGRRVKSKRPTT